MRNYLLIIGFIVLVVQGLTSAQDSTVDSQKIVTDTADSAVSVSSANMVTDSASVNDSAALRNNSDSAIVTGKNADKDAEDLIDKEIEEKINELQVCIDQLKKCKQKIKEQHSEEAIDEIDDEIDVLADKIDQLSDRIYELKEYKENKIRPDTVDAEVIIKKIQETRKFFSEKVSKARAQGYGGGAIIQPMILAVKMKPVNRLIHNSSELNGYTFSGIDDGYNLMVVSGGMGFGGVGNGLRIGFGGWAGDANYDGEKAFGVKDSLLSLRMNIGYCGMLIEKAFVHKNFNFITGGMVGGGSISLFRKVKPSNAWKSSWGDFGTGDSDDRAKAVYTGLELHSGFTVTIMPWLHIGTDVNGTFLLSISGFDGSGGDGFRAFNPGLRLRIVLGNLG